MTTSSPRTLEPHQEKLLIEEAKADPVAFGKLYDYYYPRISGYILRRVANPEDAQDITATTFYKVMTGLSKFQWRNVSFSSWVYKIATNETNSYFRRQKKSVLSLDFLFEEHAFEVPDPNGDLEQEAIEAEDQLSKHIAYLQVVKLVQAMPVKYQTILTLRYFEKKKLQEISDITGKNINTVKSLLARGTAKLRIQYEVVSGIDHKRDVQLFSHSNVIESVKGIDREQR